MGVWFVWFGLFVMGRSVGRSVGLFELVGLGWWFGGVVDGCGGGGCGGCGWDCFQRSEIEIDGTFSKRKAVSVCFFFGFCWLDRMEQNKKKKGWRYLRVLVPTPPPPSLTVFRIQQQQHQHQHHHHHQQPSYPKIRKKISRYLISRYISMYMKLKKKKRLRT